MTTQHSAVHPLEPSTNSSTQNYIVIEGGLVSNTPALPVFDLDVLESELPDSDIADELVDLLQRISAHPQARLGMRNVLDEIQARLTELGRGDEVQAARPAVDNNSRRVSWLIEEYDAPSNAAAARTVWREYFSNSQGRPADDDVCVFEVTDSSGITETIDLSAEKYRALFDYAGL